MSNEIAVAGTWSVRRHAVGARISATARYLVALARAIFAAYWADDLMGLAAEMAYNYLFALFPFFVFLAALLGFVGARVGHADLFTQVMLLAVLATLALNTVMLSGFLTYALGGWLMERIPASHEISAALRDGLDLSRGLATAAGLFVVLTLLYAVLPNGTVAFRYAAGAALFVTLAWTAITRGFGLYLTYLGQFSGTYGAFSAVIVLMVWLYAISTILLIGAELSAYPTRGRSTPP